MNKLIKLRDAIQLATDPTNEPLVIEILEELGAKPPKNTNLIDHIAKAIDHEIQQIQHDTLKKKQAARVEQHIQQWEEHEKQQEPKRQAQAEEQHRQRVIKLIHQANKTLAEEALGNPRHIHDEAQETIHHLMKLGGGRAEWDELKIRSWTGTTSWLVLKGGEWKEVPLSLWVQILEAKAEEEYGIKPTILLPRWLTVIPITLLVALVCHFTTWWLFPLWLIPAYFIPAYLLR